MSITQTRTVGSIVGGETRTEGGRIESRNPANLDDVVCEAVLASADVFVDACRAARAAQKEWARVPAPVRGKAIKQIGRLVEDNKEALARLVTREIGKPYP
jgi:alpha-ketoglutaric semialdehyde dehydrogenase